MNFDNFTAVDYVLDHINLPYKEEGVIFKDYIIGDGKYVITMCDECMILKKEGKEVYMIDDVFVKGTQEHLDNIIEIISKES